MEPGVDLGTTLGMMSAEILNQGSDVGYLDPQAVDKNKSLPFFLSSPR